MHKLSLNDKKWVYLDFALSDMCYLLPAIDIYVKTDIETEMWINIFFS